MNKLIVCNQKINRVNFINGRSGEYRVIVKVRAGFLSVVENSRDTNAISLIESYKPGAIQAIEFRAEGSKTWMTVFGLKGKKVAIIDDEILSELRVGHINSYFQKTDLYDQMQYKAVNAKSWADFAFVDNQKAAA